MLTAGIFLPAGVGVTPEPVIVDGVDSIQQQVGGIFDAVRTSFPSERGTGEGVLVGYIHDEGVLLNLDMNWLASAVFQKEIRGNCVVVCGTNDEGEYDGDDHDVPERVADVLLNRLVYDVAEAYNMSTVSALAIKAALEAGVITEDEYRNHVDQLDKSIESGEMSPETLDFLEKVFAWFEAQVEKMIGDDD